MNKRFRFIFILLIALIGIGLVFAVTLWVVDTLNLPPWVLNLVLIPWATLLLCQEIPGRFSSKPFDTPGKWFMRINRRDKIVIALSILVFYITSISLGVVFREQWQFLATVGIAGLLSITFLWLFGSKELWQKPQSRD